MNIREFFIKNKSIFKLKAIAALIGYRYNNFWMWLNGSRAMPSHNLEQLDQLLIKVKSDLDEMDLQQFISTNDIFNLKAIAKEIDINYYKIYNWKNQLSNSFDESDQAKLRSLLKDLLSEI